VSARSTLTIDPRFCGPPDVGNGGYVAGLLARELFARELLARELLAAGEARAARVSLRAPAPLAKPLVVRDDEDGGVALCSGERVIARAAPLPEGVQLEIPPPPERAEIERREGTCRAFETHPFPRCFVCGPERAPGDGLRILPGPVPGTDRVAATWLPAADLADADGRVGSEFVWAALDSPSSFPLLEDAELAQRLEPMVLGRLAVEIREPPRAGRPHRIVAWPLGLDGRRGESAIALFSETGNLVACGRATWVSIAGRT
jgi:hypothetical protein